MLFETKNFECNAMNKPGEEPYIGCFSKKPVLHTAEKAYVRIGKDITLGGVDCEKIGRANQYLVCTPNKAKRAEH